MRKRAHTLEINPFSQIAKAIDRLESQVTGTKHAIIKLIANYTCCLSTT